MVSVPKKFVTSFDYDPLDEMANLLNDCTFYDQSVYDIHIQN